MNKIYWDTVAAHYNDEIFDVLKNDRKKLVVNQIAKYSSRSQSAIDFGCGIGKFLPYLSQGFKKVLAVDLSPICISQAQSAAQHLNNISFSTMDLSDTKNNLPKADFALCVNTLLTPSITLRNRILNTITTHLRQGSHLVLVVPSLESVLLTDFRLIDWNLRDGMKPHVAVRSGIPVYKKPNKPRFREGIAVISNVSTKHFLKEEMIALLEQRNMEVIDIHKIEYPWNTEFENPPRWMKSPYPWDWLFVSRKMN